MFTFVKVLHLYSQRCRTDILETNSSTTKCMEQPTRCVQLSRPKRQRRLGNRKPKRTNNTPPRNMDSKKTKEKDQCKKRCAGCKK
ncbi:hypothetical protein KCV03_g138, partial [Aureobasidium melanogenum]